MAALTATATCLADSEETARPEIRLLSYNVHGCRGASGKLSIGRTAGVIAEQKPDVVAIQEVDAGLSRSGMVDQPAELGRILGMHATFGKTLSMGGGYGIAVLSKEKPLSVEQIPLPGREPRKLLLCEFEEFWFGSTHLALELTNRLESAVIIGQAIAERATKKPVFVAGDWNAKPVSETLDAMRKSLTILSLEKCRTFHGFKPYEPGSERCIDYVAVDSAHAGSFTVNDTHIVEDRDTSDHFPVFVSVSVSGPSR